MIPPIQPVFPAVVLESGGQRAVSNSPPSADSPLVSSPDRLLIEACLAGQERGWEAFIDRFGGLFAHVAAGTARQRGLGLDAASREDLVAEIVFECLRNRAAVLRAYAGRSSLATYLTVVARRVAVRRRLKRSPQPVPLASRRSATSAGAAEDPSRLDDREQVEALLGRLDRDEAELVRLHHLEARSYGEISRATGLPLGSIGPALSRARAKLRVMLDPAEPD
jgi:RNA polymerase sigma-70 factor (ECF subfamily)